MEFAFEFRIKDFRRGEAVIPEIEELLQARKLWRGIHVLPDEGLDDEGGVLENPADEGNRPNKSARPPSD